MSTYTTLYACGHTKVEYCQHCLEDTHEISQAFCDMCNALDAQLNLPPFDALPVDDVEMSNDRQETINENVEKAIQNEEPSSHFADTDSSSQDANGSYISVSTGSTPQTELGEVIGERVSPPVEEEFAPSVRRGGVTLTKPMVVVPLLRMKSHNGEIVEG